jgi:hypothetical protein
VVEVVEHKIDILIIVVLVVEVLEGYMKYQELP